MCVRLLAASLCCLVLLPGAWAEEKKDEKGAVKELDVKGLKRDFPRGGADKPEVIATADELAKAFPEEELQGRLKKEVDFGKQKLLFFAWSGSGQDKLTFTVEKGEKAPEVLFRYKRGLTRDLRAHFRLFVMPKEATYKVSDR